MVADRINIMLSISDYLQKNVVHYQLSQFQNVAFFTDLQADDPYWAWSRL